MSVFHATTAPQRLDPFKRVKYSLGLVLGVDEFEQEQAYFLERGRLQNRLLHGYGTVYGLEVEAPTYQVTVRPGVAIDPRGREIRVAAAQCADLNQWLSHAANRPAVKPATLPIYVVLSYRECETDQVPVPGAPCRSEGESLAPSRVTENFDLRFTLKPPAAVEEEGARLFGQLLSRIVVSNEGATITPEKMAELVLALSPDVPQGLKPSLRERVNLVESVLDLPSKQSTEILVHEDDIEAVLRTAFKVWVTEVRPRFIAQQEQAEAADPAHAGILLARLNCDLDDNWQVSSVQVEESERPILLRTREIQEYLIRREQGHDHGEIKGLEDDDHKQYLLVNPSNRALIAHLNAASHQIQNVPPATQPGEVLVYGQGAGGDLTGTFPAPTVQSLQSVPVAPGWPDGGNLMTYTEGAWRGAPLRLAQFATITRVRTEPGDIQVFHIDLHLEVGEPKPAYEAEVADDFEIYLYRANDTPDFDDLGSHKAVRIERNLFEVQLTLPTPECRRLRFLFDLQQMHEVGLGGPLFDAAIRRNTKYVGQENHLVTVPWDRPAVTAAGPQVIAAGQVDADGNIEWAVGDMGCFLGSDPQWGTDFYGLEVKQLDLSQPYQVRITPVVPEPPDGEGLAPVGVVVFQKDPQWIRVEMREGNSGKPMRCGFMVEVVQYSVF